MCFTDSISSIRSILLTNHWTIGTASNSDAGGQRKNTMRNVVFDGRFVDIINRKGDKSIGNSELEGTDRRIGALIRVLN